jgi:hypothetical protein
MFQCVTSIGIFTGTLASFSLTLRNVGLVSIDYVVFFTTDSLGQSRPEYAPVAWNYFAMTDSSKFEVMQRNFAASCYSIFINGLFGHRSRDIIVGRLTGYALEDRGFGVRVPVGSRNFSSPRRPDRL